MVINKKFILGVLMVSGVTVNSSPVNLQQTPAMNVLAEGALEEFAGKAELDPDPDALAISQVSASASKDLDNSQSRIEELSEEALSGRVR